MLNKLETNCINVRIIYITIYFDTAQNSCFEYKQTKPTSGQIHVVYRKKHDEK